MWNSRCPCPCPQISLTQHLNTQGVASRTASLSAAVDGSNTCINTLAYPIRVTPGMMGQQCFQWPPDCQHLLGEEAVLVILMAVMPPKYFCTTIGIQIVTATLLECQGSQVREHSSTQWTLPTGTQIKQQAWPPNTRSIRAQQIHTFNSSSTPNSYKTEMPSPDLAPE